MRRFWDQLTKSQRINVIAGLGLVAGVLLVQFVCIPWLESRQRIVAAIAGGEKALRELGSLGAEYGALRKQSEEIRRVVSRRPPGFSLLAYLEKKTGEAGVRGNVRAMNPLKGLPGKGYEETSVELRLDKMTMRQLADFLYAVESPEELVRIRKMTVGKMKESPEYLTVVAQVFTYQALPPGSP